MENSETRIEREVERQNTGNHGTPGATDAGGADRFGGTRKGAENVEPVTRIEKATDVGRVEPIEAQLEEDLSVSGPVAPERDEHGRL